MNSDVSEPCTITSPGSVTSIIIGSESSLLVDLLYVGGALLVKFGLNALACRFCSLLMKI